MSILPHNSYSTKTSHILAPDSAHKVLTINRQLIMKVYTRKKLKDRKNDGTTLEPVFGPVQQEYNPHPNLGKGLKRNATPVTVQNLRRSKRKDVVDKGLKPAPAPLSSSKPKGKKKTAGITPMAGKKLHFIIPQPEFPDLSVIDKCFTSGLAYPHIPI
jgi:hypothetical protein